MVKWMLSWEAGERPSTSELLGHEWFEGLR
jgi:hypothetical protein